MVDPLSSSEDDQPKDVCTQDFEPGHVEKQHPQAQGETAKSFSLAREFAIVLILSMAQFTTQYGVGSTLAILHKIGQHFNCTEPGELSWLMAAYSLTVGTVSSLFNVGLLIVVHAEPGADIVSVHSAIWSIRRCVRSQDFASDRIYMVRHLERGRWISIVC